MLKRLHIFLECALILLGLSSGLIFTFSRNSLPIRKFVIASPLPLVFDAPSGYEWWAITDTSFEVTLKDGRILRKDGHEVFLNIQKYPHRVWAGNYGGAISPERWKYNFCELDFLQLMGAEGEVHSGKIMFRSPSSPNPRFREIWKEFKC